MTQIYLVGFMGCGKTSIGQSLAKHLSYRFIDSDVFIEQYTQKSIAALFEQGGEMYFRHIEAACLQHIAQNYTQTVIATGGGMPCFFDNMALVNKYAYWSVYLKVPNEVLCERLWQMKKNRPLLQNIATQNDLSQYIAQKMAEREAFYEQASYVLSISETALPEHTFHSVLEAYNRYKKSFYS